MELDTFYVVTIPEYTKREMSFVTKKYEIDDFEYSSGSLYKKLGAL